MFNLKQFKSSFIKDLFLGFIFVLILDELDSILNLYYPITKVFYTFTNNIYIVAIGTSFVMFIYLYAVAYLFQRLYIPTNIAILSKQWKTHTGATQQSFAKKFIIGIQIIVLVQLVFSTSITLFMRNETAKVVTAAPKWIDPQPVIEKSNKIYKDNIAALNKQHTENVKAKENALNQALSQKRARTLAALVQNGNVWAKEQLRDLKKETVAQFNTTEKSINTALVTPYTDKNAEKIVAEINSHNDFERNLYSTRSQAYANLFFYIAIGSTILVIVFGYLVSFYIVGFNDGNFETLTPQPTQTVLRVAQATQTATIVNLKPTQPGSASVVANNVTPQATQTATMVNLKPTQSGSVSVVANNATPQAAQQGSASVVANNAMPQATQTATIVDFKSTQQGSANVVANNTTPQATQTATIVDLKPTQQGSASVVTNNATPQATQTATQLTREVVSQLRSQAPVYYQRSILSKSEEVRKNNLETFLEMESKLNTVGVHLKVNEEDNTKIEFQNYKEIMSQLPKGSEQIEIA